VFNEVDEAEVSIVSEPAGVIVILLVTAVPVESLTIKYLPAVTPLAAGRVIVLAEEVSTER
jgi:hypothetical protein